MKIVLTLVKDVAIALLVIAATFVIGLMLVSKLTWPATANVFGVGVSFGIWLVAMVIYGAYSKFRPKVALLSMAWLIFFAYLLFSDFSPDSFEPDSTFLKYGLDAYSVQFGWLTFTIAAAAIIGGRTTEPLLTDAIDWIRSKFKSPAEPEAA